MTKKSKTVVFFGNERLATGVFSHVPVLQALLADGYHVPAVVIAQNPAGPSRQQRRLEVAVIAEQHNIPVISPVDLVAAKSQLVSFEAQAAVLVAYGKIVPQAVLDLFPRGIINIHPSLLPQHRGPTPIENAILSGAKQTGVSLIRLEASMDSGPIYDQTSFRLKGNETKQAIADQAAAIGADMLLEHLPAILDGPLQPVPQDESKASYDQLISKADGILDWNKPAEALEREVRAYIDWPRSRTKLGSNDVIITKSHVVEASGEPGNIWREGQRLGVYTSSGVLAIDSLIPAGKQEMPVAAFLAGYQLD